MTQDGAMSDPVVTGIGIGIGLPTAHDHGDADETHPRSRDSVMSHGDWIDDELDYLRLSMKTAGDSAVTFTLLNRSAYEASFLLSFTNSMDLSLSRADGSVCRIFEGKPRVYVVTLDRGGYHYKLRTHSRSVSQSSRSPSPSPDASGHTTPIRHSEYSLSGLSLSHLGDGHTHSGVTTPHTLTEGIHSFTYSHRSFSCNDVADVANVDDDDDDDEYEVDGTGVEQDTVGDLLGGLSKVDGYNMKESGVVEDADGLMLAVCPCITKRRLDFISERLNDISVGSRRRIHSDSEDSDDSDEDSDNSTSSR
ncbi:hypothetical protein KIPB_010624 [Kipferlia bialata]|uniref:Uncharacterized protein n=1 Tax=Kipferlia bialata TaxID=797122 RepID=A0A9K3D3A9_9EUKA|nr:hypothetical protein KIPB_010624 [Kipferlia bialata]|eukprot:g10624.t1